MAYSTIGEPAHYVGICGGATLEKTRESVSKPAQAIEARVHKRNCHWRFHGNWSRSQPALMRFGYNVVANAVHFPDSLLSPGARAVAKENRRDINRSESRPRSRSPGCASSMPSWRMPASICRRGAARGPSGAHAEIVPGVFHFLSKGGKHGHTDGPDFSRPIG